MEGYILIFPPGFARPCTLMKVAEGFFEQRNNGNIQETLILGGRKCDKTPRQRIRTVRLVPNDSSLFGTRPHRPHRGSQEPLGWAEAQRNGQYYCSSSCLFKDAGNFTLTCLTFNSKPLQADASIDSVKSRVQSVVWC